MGKLPRRTAGRPHFADYPYGRAGSSGPGPGAVARAHLPPRARRGSSSNLAAGGVYIASFTLRGGPPSASSRSASRRLKRLDFVTSCGADLAALAAAAYRSGRALTPAALRPPLAAVERRVAATAAPLLAGAAARVDALLTAADERVDGVCARIGLPGGAGDGAHAALALTDAARAGGATHALTDATLAQVAAAVAAVKAVAAAPAHVRAAADAVAHLLAAAFAPGAPDAAVRAALADVLTAVPAARRLAEAPSVAYASRTYRHAHAALVASPSYERAVAALATSLGRLSTSGVGRVLLAPVTAGPAARLAAAPAVVALADHLKPQPTGAGGGGGDSGSPRCAPAGRGAGRAAAAVLTCAQC